MKAEIITIGDEILLGQVIDTNSAWIGQVLAPLHIKVEQITSISDQEEAILQALALASERVDIVIVTGGLGPTKDDVTKQTVAKYFDTTLIRNELVLEHVKTLFARVLGRGDMPLANYKQAEVLENAEVLFNDVGTAPGMWVEHGNVIYIFLPGVPFEMRFLMEQRVLPKIALLPERQSLYHTYLLTVGLGESYLAQMIADIENTLPEHIRLAYLPKLGMVRLRLSASGSDIYTLKEETDAFAHLIADRLDEYVVAHSDITFEEVIVNTFAEKELKLAIAESCTGGTIASRITLIPGASQIFDCGIVAYQNNIKERILGVNPITLEKHGAVSEETVCQMAEGVRLLSKADYGIATSGIAGPGGGTEDKPVGTVWIAVSSEFNTITQKFQFSNNREINIERSVVQALILLWKLYKKENLGISE